MKGSIQPGIEKGKVQVCRVCGAGFVHADPKTPISPLHCPNHPTMTPTRYRAKFGPICRHFDSYRAAEMELVGLNYKRVEGDFDPRDYQVKAKPLAFKKLAAEWLELKAGQIKKSSMTSFRSGIERACEAWGDANIKDLGYAQLEDFFRDYPGSPKTRLNILNALKNFWGWAVDRYDVTPPKSWPKIGHIEMAFRNTVDIPTQEAILNDIKQHETFRIWLCIKWLSTYIAIRPGEMRSLTEGQVDRARGVLIIPHPKEKRSKIIPLIEEDLGIVRTLPLAFDQNAPFFRHQRNLKGRIKAGDRLGHNSIYWAWRRACARLGIQGVSLYPGTKHSTAMGLRAVATPEEIKSMTLHSTSAAFHRYFQTSGGALKELQERRKAVVKSDHGLTTKIPEGSTPQVFGFSKK